MSLVLEGIEVYYRGSSESVLNHIQLQFQPGEFVAVIGLSGAGKSTLIRTINRLVPPSAGEVIWNGTSVTRLRGAALRQLRSQIGMIFQGFNLVPRTRVITNVLCGAIGRQPLWQSWVGYFPAELISLAEESLARVGLLEWKNRRVDQLSGGQQQRVAIARAMMQQPRMLLGDEPVSNLDPVTSRSIMDLLKQLHDDNGWITIMNLHDVRLAREYATRIIGLSHGRIVFDGPADALTVDEEREIFSSRVVDSML